MKLLNKKLLIHLILAACTIPGFTKDFNISSPDKKLNLVISINQDISLKLYYRSDILFSAENISMTLNGEMTLGKNSKISKSQKREVDQSLHPVIKEKFEVINDHFNELRIDFKDMFALEFRVYNEGIGYRFITNISGDLVIDSESLDLYFNPNDSMYFQHEPGFASAYEKPYQYLPIEEIGHEGVLCLPALIRNNQNIKILVTESDLDDYPGMWLKGTSSEKFSVTFPGYPIEKSYEGRVYGHGKVTGHADHIAKTVGKRTYPWRVFVVADKDGELITNQLVYKLAKPFQLKEASWIKPGIITFDWWARRNIYGTDFKAGINTETAKYFIDFAAEFGIEYFLFDDGWTNNEDIMDVHPDLDMDEIAVYASEKEVGLMVWLIWSTLDRQFNEVFDMLEGLGVRGIKVDFMNRDDQEMVNFYRKVADEAAKRKMVVDFHGAYKPTGLRRAYPNVLTREGLVEFEYNGSTDYANPEHHNLLPFIRMVAGPMDYIPATMNNAQKNDYRPNGDYPMGLGTRAHAIALFVVLESPMQMLPDSPSDYYRERECMEFISKIPVEWDDTKVIEAKIGDYVVIARRKGSDWYLAAITDWDAREFDITFDFLDERKYKIELIKDGVNADLRATDYKKETKEISRGDSFRLSLAPGGGFIGRIYQE